MELNAALGMIDAGIKAIANKEAQERDRIRLYEEKVRNLIQFCFTDGIDHWPGFYWGQTIWSAPDYFRYGASRQPSKFFGKSGGGDCEPDLKINIESGEIFLWGTDGYHNDPVKLDPYENMDRTHAYLNRLWDIVQQMPYYEKQIEEYISNPNIWVIR